MNFGLHIRLNLHALKYYQSEKFTPKTTYRFQTTIFLLLTSQLAHLVSFVTLLDSTRFAAQ